MKVGGTYLVLSNRYSCFHYKTFSIWIIRPNVLLQSVTNEYTSAEDALAIPRTANRSNQNPVILYNA
jgi:hypothetical protein